MATEIERKFLVKPSWQPKGEGEEIAQGYLTENGAANTVRVRLKGSRAFLTIKGKTVGITRAEFEYEIPPKDAEDLLAMCGEHIVRKRRHTEKHGADLWEIDVFAGNNAPLVVAEIELPDERAAFTEPSWLGEEVSADRRFFNSYLAEHPFNSWEK